MEYLNGVGMLEFSDSQLTHVKNANRIFPMRIKNQINVESNWIN